MELTEAGAFFYERCCLIRAEAEYAYKSMLDLSGTVRGTVTMSCPPMLGREIIAPLLVDFCQQYPLVDLKLILKNHVTDLITEKVDLCLKLTNEPDPSTVARKLLEVNWLICGSPAYLAGTAEPGCVSDLSGMAWIDQFNRGHLELTTAAGDTERIKIKTRLECVDLALVHCALLDGLGVGVLPDYIAEPSLKQGRLMQIMSDHTLQGMPGSTLYAITLPTRYMPSKVQALLDFMIRAFRR